MILETLLIKTGRKFGGDGGSDFDDSSSQNFTYSHYLSGFLFSGIFGFDGCQFIYTSSYDKQSRIESSVRGNGENTMDWTHKYYLNADERIEEVRVKSYNAQFGSDRVMAKIIGGLQFVTTKNRTIPPDISLTGDQVESESFPGYTLGYATGKSDQNINQLQFFWYRTKQ
jgi:hypothetical protein